ncbi:hypothetical protein IAE39_002323 [Pseudomonas sp. S37]|uniref:hypothetical protein n=1 Tax=Pseudomonas sp. S37 TaxID=2767449 RepID=UPI00191164CA|nr:hypothetical protein [Pseudomonas sp. S37]MBK4994149.1 hypothetical protein [Pseudomonas sp. S37]
MSLHYSFIDNGLLNHSESLSSSSFGACRAVALNHNLYCTFRSETPPNKIRFTRLTPEGGWSETLSDRVDDLEGDPAIFTFKGKLYLLSSGEEQGDEYSTAPRLVSIDLDNNVASSSNFTIDFRGTPSLVEYRGALYLFYKGRENGELRWSSTSDLVTWAASSAVYSDAVEQIIPLDNPVACVYQGLIHLIHHSESGIYLTRFDGMQGWSRSTQLVSKRFSHPPAVVVHDGLLNLFCIQPEGRPVDTAIYRYRYDGNTVGLPEVSINMQATNTPAAAVLDGRLCLVFRSL